MFDLLLQILKKDEKIKKMMQNLQKNAKLIKVMRYFARIKAKIYKLMQN